jgi:glycosyltransferase involved in cell wall biosynthesis
MEPLVSVIIPVYNSERYLAEAIFSVLNQTWRNLELIIVDDGSTDSSLSIAKTFERENVTVIHQENKGASAARNRGLNEAKGKYIQYLDGDDVLAPEKIALQLAISNHYPGAIVTGPVIHFFEDENRLEKEIQHSWIKEQNDGPVDFLTKLYAGELIDPTLGGMIALHTWLCPRDILDKAGNWNEELTVDDDGEYFCRVILASDGVKYAPDAVSYYRKYRNNKSLSGSRSFRSYQSLVKAIDLKYDHLKNLVNDQLLFNKIFTVLYNEAAVNAYPQFKKISDYAIGRAHSLSGLRPRYKAGPFSNILIKIIGWRIVRYFNYYRHGF